MSGCCGDDCSYEILSRRTKHGEASVGHTHGGGHCGGCCHWSTAATSADWLKASNFHGCVWKLELPATWQAFWVWMAVSMAVKKMNQWWKCAIPGYRYWCCIMDWDFCVFCVSLLQKQYAVWAFTHSSWFFFFFSYFLVRCPSRLFPSSHPN